MIGSDKDIFVVVLILSMLLLVHFAGQYRLLGKEKFHMIRELTVIAGICLIIQVHWQDLVMTGSAVVMGVALLFLMISNPYSNKDNLTGIYDKQYFSKKIQEMTKKGEPFHVVSVDTYRLKQVNKIFGNQTGDKLLVQVARQLEEISSRGQVFRVTSRRFVLLAYSMAEYEDYRNGAEEIFKEKLQAGEERIDFPAIICGVIRADKLKESDRLLPYLDYLVSLAPDPDETMVIQGDNKTMDGFWYGQEVERYLNTAIEQDLFEVYYQPIYSTQEGGYVSLEALSRLHHPALGAVSPDVFISIAERNGQISRIGYLQFRRICRFVREHEEIMEKIRNVKFNLSPAELLKPGYSQMLIETIREHGLRFSYFQFEITETIATEYSENLYQAVTDFLDVGIGLCLDDFGSGYANLNTVLKLPFSSIKLDRSLLCGICTDKQVAQFYHSIVSILKEMGYSIISEGVETKEELELLSGWGINLIQGYYFSRPVNGEELLKTLLPEPMDS